jgi:hypothetical protein
MRAMRPGASENARGRGAHRIDPTHAEATPDGVLL